MNFFVRIVDLGSSRLDEGFADDIGFLLAIVCWWGAHGRWSMVELQANKKSNVVGPHAAENKSHSAHAAENA